MQNAVIAPNVKDRSICTKLRGCPHITPGFVLPQQLSSGGGDGIQRNTAFNSNYVVNGLAGYEWSLGKKKNQVLGLNLKLTQAGGRRYTGIDIPASLQSGTTEYNDMNPYGEQFKTYFRTDFKISYKLNGKKVTQEWALDIQNIFDTQNPLTASFNRDTGKVRIENQQGRLPMVFYRIQF